MKPEEQARQKIDNLLEQAGWAVQDRDRFNLGAKRGVAIRELSLPFTYETTGIETRFTSHLDPVPRSRPAFAFHRPETLAGWLDQAPEDVPMG